jgi:hypothetical protein
MHLWKLESGTAGLFDVHREPTFLYAAFYPQALGDREDVGDRWLLDRAITPQSTQSMGPERFAVETHDLIRCLPSGALLFHLSEREVACHTRFLPYVPWSARPVHDIGCQMARLGPDAAAGCPRHAGERRPWWQSQPRLFDEMLALLIKGSGQDQQLKSSRGWDVHSRVGGPFFQADLFDRVLK